ncbi:Ig-like domain-containing protein [Curtobacterium sp. SL109]|uniref:Ig-like domain-containing protein n=1 Tax=Curtobacterium sp. SL109 TaxID=2994662 RepID=UPI002274517D|nr:Ig-like domain-containing protein [Curtobacterium sp. SL109]MCY1696367.1 Ig-like domain-containing protein [Curtobacterium sp. SL109]
MPPRTRATTAAALLLAFAPLAVPDVAAATEATMEERSTDDGSAPGAEQPPELEQATTPVEPAVDPSPAASPTPSVAPSVAPSPAASPAPSATAVNLVAEGGGTATALPGQQVDDNSSLNIKNRGSVAVPNRKLDIQWTITGPATFPARLPWAVSNVGTANVVGCTYSADRKTNTCVNANPHALSTGGANFAHIRVPFKVDADAMPGDQITLVGSFVPNPESGFENTSTQTSTTLVITVALTAAVINEPSTKVGPTPVIRGRGVPGGTIDLTVGDQPLVTVPVEDDGTWMFPVTEALPEGPVTVTALQHRNGMTATPTVATLDVDATAPDAPVVDDPGTLTDPTGPITGSAEPRSTVIVRDRDGNELGRATAEADGSFSVQLDEPLPVGTIELDVVAADAVGNVSPATAATATVLDTTAPDAPAVDRQELASPTGPVVGTAEPGALVVIRDQDGRPLGQDRADDDGEFAVRLDAPLDEGPHELVVVARDDAGNESGPSPVTVVAPDVTAPDAPISTTPESLTDGTGPFTGSAEPGATVIVRNEDGDEIGRGEAGPEGLFEIVLDEPLVDGAHRLELVASDASGNVSAPTPITVDVDDDAPDAPVVTSPSDLADGTGPITGTAEPGATIVIRDENGNVIGQDEADEDGNWSIELDEPLGEGRHDLEVVASDKAGNTSTPTDTTVDVDTKAPDSPKVTSPSDLSDGQGPISGTAEPGTVVVIRDENGDVIGKDEADEDGNWTVELDEPLDEGKHDLEVVASDKAGNTSTPTDTTVDIDTKAPDAPVVTSPADLADGTGPITGTAEPGATIVVRDEDGDVIGEGEADENGNWTVELDEPLDEGKHDLEVVASDKAGNASDPTKTAVDVDTKAPDAPKVTSPSDLADGKGPITGTAEPGTVVVIRDENGDVIGSDQADENGNWTVELDEPLDEGKHDLEVVASDKAGNDSAVTPVTIDIDTKAPDAPKVTSPADLADGTGPITGTAEPGTVVVIRDEDGNVIGQDEADENGNWTVELDEPLKDGRHDLEVIAQDDAGNKSAPTPTTVDVDTKAPDAPVVTSPSDLADGKGPITGTTEPGATIIIRDENGDVIGQDEADESGNWTVSLDEPLAEGKHDLEVIAQDKAGNTSDPTDTTVDIDTKAPNAPVVTSPADLADGKGPITGTAEPGATIIIRDEDGNVIGQDEADENGNWSVELDEPLTDGKHDLGVIAQDDAGNTSDSTETTVDVDTKSPDAPVVTSPSDLADGKGPITGTAEPGATVIIRDETGDEIGRDTANDNGDWSVELDEPLEDGKHDLEVIAEDTAGNGSDPTKTTVDVDTNAPDAPKVTSPTDLADGQGPITGTAEPGTIVVIRDENGDVIGQDETNENGNWTIELDEPLKDGSHDLQIVAEDKAGNASDPTDTTVDIDTKAPDAPKVTSPADLADGTGPITGTAEPGTVVVIRDEDGEELGRDTADENGSWTVELDEPLTDGKHDLEVIAEDTAGNASAATKTTVDVDTTAPAAPALEHFDDIVDGTGIVRGTAEPGSTVIVSDEDGREIGRGVADQDGRFAFRTALPLDPGAHLLTVVAVDETGNTSEGSSMLVTLVPESTVEDGDHESSPTVPGTTSSSGSLGAAPSDASPTTIPSPISAQDRELAFTGAELGGWLSAALAALGLGFVLRLLGRRRRDRVS